VKIITWKRKPTLETGPSGLETLQPPEQFYSDMQDMHGLTLDSAAESSPCE